MGHGSLARLLLVAGSVAFAVPTSASTGTGGWGYLVERLVADGLSRTTVERAFGDPRMPRFDGLEFSLRPGESHALYRGLLSTRSVRGAYDCFNEHRATLRRVERETGVPADVVAAILHVESRCGHYTGTQTIL